MKFVIALVAACLIYFLGGLVAWNLVCSFVIDLPSSTLIELGNYRLLTYSALCASVIALCFIYKEVEEAAVWIGYLGIVAIVCAMGIGVNYWDTAWTSVITILTIFYNLVNVGILTLLFYALNE